jgi:NitT/TauT family transport system ATP-binding protein
LAFIEISALTKAFVKDDSLTWVMRDVDMQIAQGEFVAIVGPSGCGKSTLLNMVAGLMQPSRGGIKYDGKTVKQINTDVGYMTQRDDLLPWRTVEGNLGLPLEIAGVRKADRAQRVADMVRLLKLVGFEKHYPSELSGGMRKRLTLGRTLLHQPKTLLLDEPFSALDAQLRVLLQGELLDLVRRFNTTTILVTHDLPEAIALADRVIVMTARPAQVKMVREVPLPRPREIVKVQGDPVFQSLRTELWSSLAPEIERGSSA